MTPVVPSSQETKKKDEPKELPELVYPGISEYPAIEARPPQPTAFEVCGCAGVPSFLWGAVGL